VEAARLSSESPLVGETVAELRERGIENLLILALSDEGDSWTFAPPDDCRLEVGMAVVYLGDPQAREELERLAGVST
jgi:Trk K+ transport system NAD-binding subunit